MEEKKHVRPSWDEYFLNLLEPIGSRGSCDRGRSGAVIVGPGHTIIATGYVGAAPGQPHCDEVGHLMRTVIDENGKESHHCVRTLHAEENAILQCARDGISVQGATIYCKMVPCYNCAMRIVRVGIKRVVALKRYHADALSLKLFRDAEINLVVMDNSIEEYSNQGSEKKETKPTIDDDGFVSMKEILMEEGKIQDINNLNENHG
ncbi:MAG: cytidine/deoxycytidylate deaminase family protein [Candidatus Staskawiczbacteria bacterium]|jgi:dCMP deaminase